MINRNKIFLVVIFGIWSTYIFAQNPFLNKLESRSQQYIIAEIETKNKDLLKEVERYKTENNRSNYFDFPFIDSILTQYRTSEKSLQKLRSHLITLNSHLNIGNDDTTRVYIEKTIINARNLVNSFSEVRIKNFPYSEMDELLWESLAHNGDSYKKYIFLTELLIVNHQHKLLGSALTETQTINHYSSFFTYSITPIQDVYMDGESYEADIFLQEYGMDSIDVILKVENKAVKIEGNKAVVNFPIKFDDEKRTKEIINRVKCKQSWKGRIDFFVDGTIIQSISLEEEYYVVKPIIMTMGGSIPLLYRGLVNDIQILTPSLSNDFQPTYKLIDSDDELIVDDKSPYRISIIPGKDENCKLEVFHKNIKIGVLNYKVNPVPDPYVTLFLHHKHLKFWEGLLISDLSNVYVKAFADDYLKRQYPGDMKYKVYKYRVDVVRNGEVIYSKKWKGKDQIADHSLLETAKPGDVLNITTEKILRLNAHTRKAVEVDMAPVNLEVVLK